MDFKKLLRKGLDGFLITRKEIDEITISDKDYNLYGIKDFYDCLEVLQERNIIIVD